MATALDLINASLRDIGVLAGGETASAADASDALSTVNRLIDGWRLQKIYLSGITRTTWTISANDGEYTVGSSANITINRPNQVDRVCYTDSAASSTTFENELKKLTEAGWQAILDKSDTAVQPQAWFYNPTYANGTLHLWPVPTSSTLTGVLYAPTQISQFAALTTTVTLAPGFERFIVKHLALELAPSYGRSPSPLLVTQAQQARAVLLRSNRRLVDLSHDPGALAASGSYYDISQG